MSRKASTMWAAIIAIVFLLTAQTFAIHRIMPLGDSITRGMGGDPPYTGYRDDLYWLLVNDDWDFDFVGSQSDGSGFDADHEGHGGWKAEDILANIDTWLQDSAPDVILLHIGTNDISSGQSNSSTIDEIEGILDRIYAYNPQITILLCKLIPRLETPANEYLQNEELNGLIEDLYNEKKDAGYYIYLVDQFNAFKENPDWRTDYMIDNVHPNEDGYAVMAQTFFSVLQTVNFPELTLTIVINPDGAGRVDLDPDRSQYAYYEEVEMTAVAYHQYRFDHWSGDIDVTSSNPRTIRMYKDRTIVANFVSDEDEFVSTPQTPSGPDVGNTGQVLSFSTGGSSSNLGDEVEYQFDWGDGEQSSWGDSAQSHAFAISGTYQVKARARCKIHTSVVSTWSNAHAVTISGDTMFVLTIVINPPGAGEVRLEPDKSAYEPNEQVTMTAIPANSNFQFMYWTGDIDTTTANPRSIYMVKNRTIVANFHSNVPYYTLDIGIDPDGAGIVTKNPDKTSYQEGEVVELTAQGAGNSTDKIYIEGESGVRSGAMQVGDDLDASNGQFVYNTSAQPKSGSATYNFEVLESGSYVIWGRCYALSSTEDSFFLVVDGSTDTLTWHLESQYYTWKWQKVSDWYTVQEFNLDKGQHTMTLIARDKNARLDKFILSKDPNFVPSGKEESNGGTAYVFDSWSGDLTGSENPVSIVMNSNKAVTAHFVEINETVTVPNKPSGPAEGEVGVNLTYSTGGSESSLGNPVEYQFDFGDGNLSDWGGSTRTHAYSAEGSFVVRARARSKPFPQVVSNWSEGLNVDIANAVHYTLTVNVIPEGAGSVDMNPSKSYYNVAEWVQLTAIPRVKDNNIRLEAESGTLSGNIALGNDPSASGDKYIYGTSREPKSGSVDIEFQVLEAGSYYVWGRCYALSSTEDSFFFIMDHSADTLTWHLESEYNIWKWQKVSDWHVVQTFDLNPGWHTITILLRDINARLDNLLITSDPNYQPTGKEEFNSNIKIEAESGNFSSPFEVGTDANASNNQYLYCTSATPRAATSTYNVEISTPGVYYIWGRCYALSGTEDSFFFQLDDQNVMTWHMLTDYNVWKWQKVSDNHEPQSFNLEKGMHTIKVISRDVNVRLDKLLLTTNASYVPEGKEDTPTAADANYRFDRWEGDITGVNNPIDIQMSSDKVVYAYFVITHDYIAPPTEVTGPSSAIIGEQINVTASGATSEQGNPLQYQFDWGDGTYSSWGAATQSHIYTTSGTMVVKARARSAVDSSSVSNWADEVQIIEVRGLHLTVTVNPANSGTVTKTPSKTEYALNDTVSLTPNPNDGFAFDHWSGDISGTVYPIQVVMNSDKSVTAVFQETEEIVSKPNIPTGPAAGILGQQLQYSATGSVSNLGHEVEYQFSWGDGNYSDWGTGTESHTYSLSGLMHVKARARCKIHPNVISSWSDSLAVTITGLSIATAVTPTDAGIIVKNPNKNRYQYGEKVAVSAVANTGFEFDHWEGDLSGNANPDTIVMNDNRSIIAVFKQAQESVSVPLFITGPDTGYTEETINFTTGGSVSNFGNPIQYQFDWGDGTLSAWGDSVSSHIYNLVGSHEVRARARSSVNNSVVSNWTSSKTIVILSIYYEINITIDPENSGTVMRLPYKSQYREGEVVVLTPLPAEGYVFESWSGDLVGIDNPAIIQIDGNKNIVAHFKNISSIRVHDNLIPETFALEQNYPNPFNPETSIHYQLAKSSHVTLRIFNMHGQLIETLIDEDEPAGYYAIRWHAVDNSGRRLPSGVYLYQIETPYFRDLKKMILLK